MITEIMHFNRLCFIMLVAMTAIAGYYLCLVMLTSNGECHLSRSTACLGANYYVHLDNLSDVSAYRTAVKP